MRHSVGATLYNLRGGGSPKKLDAETHRVLLKNRVKRCGKGRDTHERSHSSLWLITSKHV